MTEQKPRRGLGWTVILVICAAGWAVMYLVCSRAADALRQVLPLAPVLALRPRLGGRRRYVGQHRPETVVPVGPYYLLTRYRYTIEATLDALGPTPPRWGVPPYEWRAA